LWIPEETYMIDRFVRRRTTAVLFLAQSLFTAAVIASFTLSPVIAADLSGREGAAGLPTTITLIGRAAMAYPAGWLMDRAGRRLGLSLGFVLGAAGGAVSVLAIVQGSFPIFLAGALLLGVMRGTAEQGRYAAAEVYPASRRARIIGIIVFAGTLGAVGGPLLVGPAGELVARWGLPVAAGPYVATAVLLALALALIFLMLRPDPAHLRRLLEDGERRETVAETASFPISTILRRPAVQLSIAALVIGQLVMTMLMVVTPLYMDHQQHGPELISWVIMAHTLGMFGLSGLTGWLTDRLGRFATIFAGGGLLALSAVLAPAVSGVPLLALALFLLGLGWNFSFVAGSSLLTDAVSAEEQGRVQGASEMVVGLASGLGSLGAGILFEQAGIWLPAGVGLALAAGLMGLTLFTGPVRQLVLKADA
jgi:MFS family permease